MFDDARVDQAGIFIPLKFENGIVHHRAVENVEADQQFKIFDRKARHFFEQPRFQLRDDVFRVLSIYTPFSLNAMRQ